MLRGAKFSDNKKYRYALWRIWGQRGNYLNFVMLNPSNADEQINDPTVQRCENRANQLGYDGLFVTNLYGLISTNPQLLYEDNSSVGELNDKYIGLASKVCDRIICGWGVHGSKVVNNRVCTVMDILTKSNNNISALQINADGSPRHPLYIKYDKKPINYNIGVLNELQGSRKIST